MRIKVGIYLLGHILTAFQQAKGHQHTKKNSVCVCDFPVIVF